MGTKKRAALTSPISMESCFASPISMESYFTVCVTDRNIRNIGINTTAIDGDEFELIKLELQRIIAGKFHKLVKKAVKRALGEKYHSLKSKKDR